MDKRVDLPKRLPFMSGHKSLQTYNESLQYMLLKQDLTSLSGTILASVHLNCHSSWSMLNISVTLRL